MKAEKRHELEQNELADWLGEQIEAAKPYAPTIGIALVGGILVILLVIYLVSSGGTASARAWSSYFMAFNQREPEVTLETFAKDMPNTPASLWAVQAVGDIHLSRGAMQLFSDREEAKKSLDKAEASLLQVEKEAQDKMLKTRARLSLGKLYETLCKPDDAKKYYEMAVADEGDSAIGKLAKRAVERLSDPRDVELLAWFAEQKPRRPVPGFGPGGLPGLPNDLPERPDFSLPGLGIPPTDTGSAAPTGLNLDGIGSGKADDSKLDFPKPGETRPAGEKPVGEKSTEPTNPAPPANPAEPKPEVTPPVEKAAETKKPE